MIKITGLPAPDALTDPQNPNAHWPWVRRAANAVLDALMVRTLDIGPSPSLAQIGAMMDAIEAIIRRVLLLMALAMPSGLASKDFGQSDPASGVPRANTGPGDGAAPFPFFEIAPLPMPRDAPLPDETPPSPNVAAARPKPLKDPEFDLDMARLTLRIAGILRVTTMPHAYARQVRRRLDRQPQDTSPPPPPFLNLGAANTPTCDLLDPAIGPLSTLLQRVTTRAYTRLRPIPPD